MISKEELWEKIKDDACVVLVGPTAAGKDTLMRWLEKQGMKVLVSHTSRPMRADEVFGREYWFVHNFMFNQIPMLEKRVYIMEDQVWQYGLSVEEGMKDGVLILDWHGYCELAKVREVTLVYVGVEKEIARERYMRRGSSDDFDRRWENDSWIDAARDAADWVVMG